MKLELDRRTLLRGLGGLAIGLPMLDVMRPRRSAAGEPEVPKRYLVGFGGFSLCMDHTTTPPLAVPAGVGRDYVLHPLAANLHDLHDDLLWLSGMSIPIAPAGGQPPPGGRHHNQNSFHQHLNPMLAGMRQVGDGRSTKVTGPTTDQRVADTLGADSRFRSLHLRGQVLPYGFDTDAYAGVLSFRGLGDSVVPIAPYTSPRQVFDLLTTGIPPSNPVEALRLQAELRKRKSVLDFIDLRMGGLHARLGAADQARLERHWNEIRELERRLDLPPPVETATCTPPTGWYEDPPILTTGDSGENERIRRFHELIRYAFACDLTRVVTLQYTNFLSLLSGAVAGASETAMHDIVHFGPAEELDRVVTWHLDTFGDLVRSLRDTPEGDGSVLDNSALALMIEGGYGFMEEDPTQTFTHSNDEMLTVVAGRAGGIDPGRHVVTEPGENHPVQALVSLMNAVGVDVDGHGEVEGSIGAVFG